MVTKRGRLATLRGAPVPSRAADEKIRRSASRDEALALLKEDLRLAEENVTWLLERIEDLGDLEDAHQAELAKLQADHREELEDLRVGHVVALGAFEEARHADLGQLQMDHRQELTDAIERENARHRAELDARFAVHTMRVVELQAMHAEGLGDATRAAEERVAALERERDEARAALEVASLSYAAADERWIERYRELADAHARELDARDAARAEAEDAHAVEAWEQLEALAEDHQKAVAALAAEHAEVLSAERTVFEQMVSALQDELARSERRLEVARGEGRASPNARIDDREAHLRSERPEQVPLDAEAQPTDESTGGESTAADERSRQVHASIREALLAAAAKRDAER